MNQIFLVPIEFNDANSSYLGPIKAGLNFTHIESFVFDTNQSMLLTTGSGQRFSLTEESTQNILRLGIAQALGMDVPALQTQKQDATVAVSQDTTTTETTTSH